MDLTEATTKDLVDELVKRKSSVKCVSINEMQSAFCSVYSKQFGSLMDYIDVPTGPASILVVKE
ncbi:MAG: hypothetical protein WCX79_01130 [Candidatus Paceibacterota bacterium]|jgi:hypothetical protein